MPRRSEHRNSLRLIWALMGLLVMVWAGPVQAGEAVSALCFTAADLSSEQAQALRGQGGALVESVEPNSPAAKVGLVSGDVVVQLGPARVSGLAALREALAKVPAGKPTDLVFVRRGQTYLETVTPRESGSAPGITRREPPPTATPTPTPTPTSTPSPPPISTAAPTVPPTLPPREGTPPGGLIERGNALLNQWKFQEALAAFDEMLRANPGSPDAQIGRGGALNALGDVAGAIQAYEAALREQPGRQNVRAWLAELWLASGDYQRAEVALQEELRLFPSSAWARSYVGTLYLLEGKQAEAGQAMAEALRLDPAVVNHRYQNGTFLGTTGQHRRALVEFASVLALDPNMPAAYFGVGVSSAHLGATAQAIQAFEAYLQRDASSEWAQKAREELARLRAQAPVPNPAGHPLWLGGPCPPGTTLVLGSCLPTSPGSPPR